MFVMVKLPLEDITSNKISSHKTIKIKSYIDQFLKYKKLKFSMKIFFENINLGLRGGGKKRKKKNYTKPKKIKHVRKKISLKILSYYSVQNDSIRKLRKESPESRGCFMAEHKDRLTCGKTGITFVRNIV